MSTLPQAFIIAKGLIYDLLDLSCSDPLLEKESSEYAACTFSLNNHNILFRSAKITPTKTGQFVTLWKRNNQGPIAPFDDADIFDFVVVCVQNKDYFGQFIFPKSILLQKGILTDINREGKRAFRVYPNWDKPTSKQAQKTQDWQLNHFYAFSKTASNEKMLLKIQELLD